ncbi:hypothetical protein ACLOAV_002263 [Pseudogymnoascus australis]
MPNFYNHPRAGLITPPDSGHAMYGYRNTGPVSYNQNSRKNGYDGVSYAAPPAPLMYQAPPMHYNNMPSVAAPGMPNQSYGPIAAPILPAPISDRPVDAAGHNAAQRFERRPQQAPAKQEKITGGVAQELDYEMDQMTDYVSDMAQSMYALLCSPHIRLADIDLARSVMPGSKVSPAFRKFVSGLLSSTRLPSSTILLGMNYLARRMSMLNSPTPRKTTDGQVWRMLTIGLLLGSKFLDDNTFQNRSWSEVSGIAVSELNSLEKEWLQAIEWNLHVDPVTDTDFHSWLASWASWKETKNKQRNATLERLAPLAAIDTNVQRNNAQRKQYSPTSASYGFGQGGNENHPLRRTMSQLSPAMNKLHGRRSGPNTPEWMMLPNSGLPPTDWYGYDAFYNNRRNQQPSAHISYALPQTTPYQTPYHSHYSQNLWGHHAGCGCGYCGRPTDSYFMPTYGQQTVAG